MSKVASLAFKDKSRAGINTLARSTGNIWRAEALHLLWNNSVVVFQNEPLNLLSPQTLLLYSLGLKEHLA